LASAKQQKEVGTMKAVDNPRRGLEELTDEQFVSAVIRGHERVIAGLRALADGVSPREDATGEDAEIIRSYAGLHGVDDGVLDFTNTPRSPRMRVRTLAVCS
jgi:hypothetical protein